MRKAPAVEIVVVIALLVVGAAPVPALAEKPIKGGTLRVAFSIEPLDLDPAMGRMGTDHNVLFGLYDALVDFDKDLNPRPMLAERWVTPDPKTYIFHLRKGVKFHDGTPFNAEVARWNIMRHKEPKVPSFAKGQLAVINSIDVVDEYTIKINLARPSASLPMILSDRGGMMVSRAAAEKRGPDFGHRPVGAGPFKLARWTSDVSIEFERVAGYWNDDAISLDKIIFYIVKDATTRVAKLRAGEVDLVYMTPAKDVGSLEADRRFKVAKGPTTEHFKLWLNRATPLLANKKVRQAIAHAIDREALARAIWLGYGQPAYGSIPAGSAFFCADAVRKHFPKPRDVERARQLLREAGFPGGITVEDMSASEEPFLSHVTAVQGLLKDAGITLKLNVMDRTKANDMFWKEHRGDSFSQRWTGRPEVDMTVTEMFHTKGAYNSGWGAPLHPGLDDLIEQARASYDVNERKRRYCQIQDVLLDEAADLNTVFPFSLYAMRQEVMGLEVYQDGKLHLKQVWLKK